MHFFYFFWIVYHEHYTDKHEWRLVTKCLGYFFNVMETLRVEFPVGTDKGEKECRITLEIIDLYEINFIMINRADPVTLLILMHMLKYLDR